MTRAWRPSDHHPDDDALGVPEMPLFTFAIVTRDVATVRLSGQPDNRPDDRTVSLPAREEFREAPAKRSRREHPKTTARALSKQCRLILAHLQTGARLNQRQAIELFACYRLPSRIHELRRGGHKIDDETIGRMKDFFIRGAP